MQQLNHFLRSLWESKYLTPKIWIHMNTGHFSALYSKVRTFEYQTLGLAQKFFKNLVLF